MILILCRLIYYPLKYLQKRDNKHFHLLVELWFRTVKYSRSVGWGWGCRIHRLLLCRGVSLPLQNDGPVGWGCTIYWLRLCRGLRPPPTSVLGMTLIIWWWGSSNAGALGNAKYPFIAIAPRSTRARSGSTWQGPIYGSNRTQLCTFAKLNCLKKSCFDM